MLRGLKKISAVLMSFYSKKMPQHGGVDDKIDYETLIWSAYDKELRACCQREKTPIDLQAMQSRCTAEKLHNLLPSWYRIGELKTKLELELETNLFFYSLKLLLKLTLANPLYRSARYEANIRQWSIHTMRGQKEVRVLCKILRVLMYVPTRQSYFRTEASLHVEH